MVRKPQKYGLFCVTSQLLGVDLIGESAYNIYSHSTRHGGRVAKKPTNVT